MYRTILPACAILDNVRLREIALHPFNLRGYHHSMYLRSPRSFRSTA